MKHAITSVLNAFEQQTTQGKRTSSAQRQAMAPLSLTVREQEVFHLLEQGKTNQEIANQLVVSLATAKKHVSNILSKLGVENRVQAVTHARDFNK